MKTIIRHKNCGGFVLPDLNNSFSGMMKTVSDNYNIANMNADEIMNKLDDPEKIGLVKEVLEKIG